MGLHLEEGVTGGQAAAQQDRACGPFFMGVQQEPNRCVCKEKGQGRVTDCGAAGHGVWVLLSGGAAGANKWVIRNWGMDRGTGGGPAGQGVRFT